MTAQSAATHLLWYVDDPLNSGCPAATILAAVVAVVVTYRLGKGQQRIMKQQAAISLSQLRHNLFEKRYAIYEAAQEAIGLAIDRRDEDVLPEEIKIIFLKFEEARFFFCPDICAFLEKLHKDIMNFLQQNYNHRREKEGFIKPYTAEVRKAIAEKETALLQLEEELYIAQKNLPKTFAPELAFPEFTR